MIQKKEEGRMKFKVEKKMSVEEYVDFFSPSTATSVDNFTISYLNQIIHMHGFRKLHKAHKKILGEVVDALDLIDPSRSTLKQTGSVSSSSSSLTLDEVITDIEALKWQECCFTSLQIINSDSPAPKPYQKKSNKRKTASTTTKKSAHDKSGTTTTRTTMISFPALPKKMRTKKTMKSITSVNEAAAAAPKPLSHYNYFPSRFPTTTIP